MGGENKYSVDMWFCGVRDLSLIYYPEAAIKIIKHIESLMVIADMTFRRQVTLVCVGDV